MRLVPLIRDSEPPTPRITAFGLVFPEAVRSKIRSPFPPEAIRRSFTGSTVTLPRDNPVSGPSRDPDGRHVTVIRAPEDEHPVPTPRPHRRYEDLVMNRIDGHGLGVLDLGLRAVDDSRGRHVPVVAPSERDDPESVPGGHHDLVVNRIVRHVVYGSGNQRSLPTDRAHRVDAPVRLPGKRRYRRVSHAVGHEHFVTGGVEHRRVRVAQHWRRAVDGRASDDAQRRRIAVGVDRVHRR